MTVAELKAELAKYPDDMEVYFEGKAENYFPVEYTETISYSDGETIYYVLELGSYIKPE